MKESEINLINKNLFNIENKIQYVFKDKSLLRLAFMHSSKANEYNVASNERLEFFGDAILEFIVSEYLMEHSKKLEGDLTTMRASLVSAKSLSKIIETLGIAKYLIINKNSNGTSNITENIECDLYESILGAIYIDGGMKNAKQFVYNTLSLNNLDLENYFGANLNFKSALQELLQSKGITDIKYTEISATGPAHSPTFKIALLVNDIKQCEAEAGSKKQAEQECAKIAYIREKEK